MWCFFVFINHKITTENGENTTKEYYLRSSTGTDLATLDMTKNKLTWYVHGASRIAHFEHQNELPEGWVSDLSGTKADSTKPKMGPTPAFVAPPMIFYNYDHLGNTRLTYSATVKLGDEPGQEQYAYTAETIYDYDPYGKILRSFTKSQEKYLTTGHERDTETDLDYRGARFYDSDVVRFLSLDPHQSKYPTLSPYNYVACNPNLIVDSDGRDNISYVVITKEGLKALKNAGLTADNVISALNGKMAEYGLKHKFELVTTDLDQLNYIDKTDAVHVLGVGNDIHKIANDNLTCGTANVYDGSKVDDYSYDENNPEITEPTSGYEADLNNSNKKDYGNFSTTSIPNAVAFGNTHLKGTNNLSSIVFIMLHGEGHLSGNTGGHSMDSPLYWSGNKIHGEKVSDLTKPGTNGIFIKGIESRYGHLDKNGVYHLLAPKNNNVFNRKVNAYMSQQYQEMAKTFEGFFQSSEHLHETR